MKMIYDGNEHELKLKRPNWKQMKLLTKLNDEDFDQDIDILGIMVDSVDGVPIDDVDAELQWAAMFAGMTAFQGFAEKKSGRNGAGQP